MEELVLLLPINSADFDSTAGESIESRAITGQARRVELTAEFARLRDTDSRHLSEAVRANVQQAAADALELRGDMRKFAVFENLAKAGDPRAARALVARAAPPPPPPAALAVGETVMLMTLPLHAY